MKTYLLLSLFICSMLGVNAQNATKSTISFNHVKGLSTYNEEALDSVYHNMNDLNYHYFNLVSKAEIAFHQQQKLLRLIKARAAKVMDYYKNKQQVETQNLFIKYSGNLPTLWLHKPVGQLTASGDITLDDNERQCFSFNTMAMSPVITKNGNSFYFSPNAFETMSGSTIDNQNITICVYEFIDKKTLVFAGLTTDANGKMLETGGSFYIEANLNGEELQLKRGESYTVEMRSTVSHPDMFTYYGGTKDGLIDWTVNPNEPAIPNGSFSNNQPTIPVVEIQQQLLNLDAVEEMNNYGDGEDMYNREYNETVQAVDFYEMSAGKLGWINCDRFYEAKNTTTLAVKVNTDKNMVVRIVFRDINSVMPCYSNSNHKDKYQASGIPVGEKVLLLAYSVKDDNAVLGYKEITVGENATETITVSDLTKTRFKSAVSELLSY